MMTGLLHRIVARPWVYDLAQVAAGARSVRKRIAQQATQMQGAKFVLDIGGGTGAVGALWDERTRYLCLDIDPQKLEGFSQRNPHGVPLLGDATCLPIASQSIDVVLCNSVTHHLTDILLEKMIAEMHRVLKVGGRLILTDAVWQPRRWVGRLIWKYDRGSYPRRSEILRAIVATRLNIHRWDAFAVWHEYFICVAIRA